MEVVNEEVVLRNKKHYQNEQFNTIVKALLYFEAKLKSDQKNIRQILFEKDEIINRQWNEIINFKKKYNDNTKIDEIDDVAKYCPKCRKNYYLFEKKNVEIQTFNGRGDGGESKDSISPQSVEFLSSSEDSVFEKSCSFAGARRSKKYTSKRTSGNYSEYIRSRQSSNSSPNSNKNYDVKYSCRINNMHGIKQQEQDLLYEPVEVKNENYDSSHNELNSSENEYSDEFQSKEFETTDDWYASASDIEDSDCNIIKPYGHNAINPVLECVNQILLQQSMDGFLDGTNSDTPDLSINQQQQQQQQPKDSTLTRQKRVHFSTQNSMVQVPRNITPPPSESNNSSKIEEKNNSYEVQSIYSNEYEPIGSEHNSSNYYIDMESKIGQEYKTTKYEKSNKPPDLPPKPPNLMKRKQFPKFYIPQVAKSIISSNSSEPDYCSISEINVTTAKIVQIVADVHKSPSSKGSEVGSEELLEEFVTVKENPLNVENLKIDVQTIDDETFANIPKLPNVAAIIPPKKETLKGFISQDNYIINKSPLKTTDCKKQIPLVLSEISPIKKPQQIIINESPKKSPKINLISESISHVKIIEDKMPMQAEFDWYNLDAEYGKVLQPDIIQETDSSDLLEKDDDEFTEEDEDIPKIEYILDDEYNPVIQPDLVIKKKTTEPIFKPVLVDTPKIYRNRNESYDTFLDESGFCIKPILTKRKKVYYSGPYV